MKIITCNGLLEDLQSFAHAHMTEFNPAQDYDNAALIHALEQNVKGQKEKGYTTYELSSGDDMPCCFYISEVNEKFIIKVDDCGEFGVVSSILTEEDIQWNEPEPSPFLSQKQVDAILERGEVVSKIVKGEDKWFLVSFKVQYGETEKDWEYLAWFEVENDPEVQKRVLGINLSPEDDLDGI